jgi:hypothetical protein
LAVSNLKDLSYSSPQNGRVFSQNCAIQNKLDSLMNLNVMQTKQKVKLLLPFLLFRIL